MENELKKDLQSRMEGAVESLKKDFSGLRTGRANPALLNSVVVDAYGAKTPLNQCANISAPEPRLLTVSVWDTNLVSTVEKAIRDMEMSFNPMSEGNVIRISIPELTEERRKEISKLAGQYAEHARVAVRNVRRDGIDKIKKSELPEDEERRIIDEIQELTDKYVKTIDTALADKETELMKV